jgi:hypothetical protein
MVNATARAPPLISPVVCSLRSVTSVDAMPDEMKSYLQAMGAAPPDLMQSAETVSALERVSYSRRLSVVSTSLKAQKS